MDSDVKASAPLTATGAFGTAANSSIAIGRARIRAVRFVNGASAGSVVFRDGGASGAVVLTLGTAAVANEGTSHIDLPGRGILCQTSVHGTVTNTAETVIFYEGV